MSDDAFALNNWKPQDWYVWCDICEVNYLRAGTPARSLKVTTRGEGDCVVCLTCLKRLVTLLESDGATPTAA